MTGPERYLHGGRGDRIVIVPQKVASLLFRSRLPLRELHERVRGQDAEVDAVLVALALAARETAGSEVGTNSAPRPEPMPRSIPKTLTTRQLADRAGIGVRAVVKAIHSGRLRAAQDADGIWHITPVDADTFSRNRKGTE